MKLEVDKESILYDYLKDNVNESKNTIKGFLTKKMVNVNGKIITRYDYKVKSGDIITIGNNVIDAFKKEIKIIYEDEDIIVVDKPSGMLTIATLKEKEKTMYSILSNYVKKQNKNNKIFVVHRLDRDTSGLIIFAKNEKIKNKLQDNWNENTIRKYNAVVHGEINNSGSIKLKLKNSNSNMTYVSNDGELAITEYKRLDGNSKSSYIEINILTGKKNQIRVSFAHIGNPLYGDKKYGIKDNSKRLMLHASYIELKEYKDRKNVIFKSNIPRDFNFYKKEDNR